jgi:serine/threonine protein kinase
MIVVQCPSCGAKLTAHEPRADGTADCPRCGERLTLPASASRAEAIDAAPPAHDPGRTLTFGGAAAGIAADAGRLHIPGYEVMEEIGRGGMGVVYKARQINPPRLVALKMILAGEHADPEQLARFRAEAEAIARLSHPAITQIHQVGEWHPPEGGPAVPFLTLEFVAGHSLARRLGSGTRVEPAQAADLVRQLADGVHYAHRQGIVHRDLKPGNILLTGAAGPDTLGEAKIVDFGLAKPLDGFASTVTDFGPRTRTGAVLGTPSYMAPEQAGGKGKIGPTTDVWALGVILYECLTGRPPFVGESTLETLIQVTKDDPEPPRRIRPKVPRDLETICLTCLAKDPARRYPSAAALAEDLGRFLAGEPVTVRPPARRERLGRWVRRRKEVVYLAGGAALALAVVLAIALTRPDPATENRAGVPVEPLLGPPPNTELPLDSPIAESRRRMISQSNLMQIGIGLHNMDSAYGTLPPPAIYDKAGKPLLSWRVAILQYIEQETLYRQFKLDEPWDSENNKKLIAQMPRTYAIEGKSAGPPGTTHYQAVVGRGTAWEVQPQLGGMFGRRGLTFASFTDGTANTILLVEAADPVVWTKPEDVTFDGREMPKFGGVVKGGFSIALGDGSVQFVRDTPRPEDVRAALTRNGGEVFTPPWQTRGAGPNEMKTAPDPRDAMKAAPAPSGELRGRVTLNGKPVTGVWVRLKGDGTSTAVTVAPDGTYSLGLESGSYQVAIEPRAEKPPKGAPPIPQRYTDPATSGLTVQVRPGQQVVDFDLTDAIPKK